MGVTGLIWLAIIACWLAYLVPRFVLKSEQGLGTESVAPKYGIADSMRVVRHGNNEFSLDTDPGLQISTPLQRKSVLFEVHRAQDIAARRRRVGLLGSVALMIAGVVIAIVTPAPWWLSLVGVGLLLISVVVCRYSVHTVDAMVADKLAAVCTDWMEDTVAMNTIDLTEATNEDTEISIELDLPVPASMGSLWEPIAVTPPTYVSKPLVPRSVRTIDLTAPVPPASQPKLPVTAERPPQDDQDYGEGDLPRAVGE